MDSKSQEIIRRIKESKQKNKISCNEIMEALPKENGIPALSLTTLRRVLKDDSEARASSFNYEETLLPIAEAISRIEGTEQTKDVNTITDGIGFLMEQISEKDALIKRLIDRLDQKDAIIHQFLIDMNQKDVILSQLMEKCFNGKE